MKLRSQTGEQLNVLGDAADVDGNVADGRRYSAGQSIPAGADGQRVIDGQRAG